MKRLGFPVYLVLGVCLGVVGCQTPEKRAAAEHTFTLAVAHQDPGECGQMPQTPDLPCDEDEDL